MVIRAGLNTPQAKRRVVTRYVENVTEGADAERVIREMARTGVDLIITPSFGYMEPTLKVAAEFPQVRFQSIPGYERAPNVATAHPRFYEGPDPPGVAGGPPRWSRRVSAVDAARPEVLTSWSLVPHDPLRACPAKKFAVRAGIQGLDHLNRVADG